ncbi:hypothetical protein F53441_3672 [Fusarium austroafricanum]|uniref:Uncharacterized protein n=1 Tax=Fusarium austroafricanum TaxID=2364996 RepID=A0A8H4P1I2_9HYPO|nr:hypothetical protein F53441_3672 [Fusarium austroafricanum]
MAPEPHFFNSTSSIWPTEDACPSTLRARLRDDDTPATSSSVKPIPYQDIYQQVNDCLGRNLASQKRRKIVHVSESNDPATQLRESYARMGMALHNSAIENLVKAHAEVQSKMTSFAEKSSHTLAQSKDLYSNITYPLYATLCHSENHPRANVAVHLNGLKRDIAAAREEILRLEIDWDACCEAEAEAWKAINEELGGKGHGSIDKEAVKVAKEFKAEAEAIVAEKCQLIDELDMEIKAELKNQTLKMMQELFDE